MGKISIEDLIKIIKVVRTIKDKKKRRKKRRQIKKMLEAQGIKSLSSHMTGSANTHQTNLLSEALNIANKSNEQKINQNKQLEGDKNDEKIKALMNSHNEFITNANQYAFNTDNSLNNINNKLDRLENRSFNTDDSNDVPSNDAPLTAQTRGPHQQNFDKNATKQTVDSTSLASSINQSQPYLSYNSVIDAIGKRFSPKKDATTNVDETQNVNQDEYYDDTFYHMPEDEEYDNSFYQPNESPKENVIPK